MKIPSPYRVRLQPLDYKEPASGGAVKTLRKVMRILRAEEKRIRRSYGSDSTSEDEDSAEKSSDSVLSLDAMPEDDVKSAAWLAGSRDCMEELITALKEKELFFYSDRGKA